MLAIHDDRRINPIAIKAHEERRSYSANFKAQVALEALKGSKTLTELAEEFSIHPNQINLWQQQLTNNIELVFNTDKNDLECTVKTTDNRHSKIGQLMVENDFLTKVLGR